MARRHIEHGLSLYAAQPNQARTTPYERDPELSCRIYLTLILWMLGYPDQALRHSREVLRLARERAHPHSLAFALLYMAAFYQACGEVLTTQALAEEVMTHAQTHGFSLWLGAGTILRGCTLAAQGQKVEGMAQMRQGLIAYQGTGAYLGQSLYLMLLAGACLHSGQVAEGLAIVQEALHAAEVSGVQCHAAELYRLKGELLLVEPGNSPGQTAQHRLQEAEESIVQALTLAQHQGAKAWELRAALSFFPPAATAERAPRARSRLAEVYGWFTEGFASRICKRHRRCWRWSPDAETSPPDGPPGSAAAPE